MLISPFNKSKVFLPVIHPLSFEIAHESIQIAIKAGADGIFLINQGMNAREVLELSRQVHVKYPNFWIGLNLLGYSFFELFNLLEQNPHIQGLWVDNGHINELDNEQQQAAQFAELRQQSSWKGLYFGGVAFKGQRAVAFENLAKAGQIGSRYIDIVTTSGPGTGFAADLLKIQEIRKGLGETKPLAIASGITPENIMNYISLVDIFLVATGIEQSFGRLDFEKTKQLADFIKLEE